MTTKLKIEIAKVKLENQHAFALNTKQNPKLLAAIWAILQTVVAFADKHAIDPITGAKVKIKWYHFVLRKEYRQFVWKVIDDVLDLFVTETE